MELKLSKNFTNQQIAQLFEFISGVLTVTGADPFRIRAYEVAGESIGSYKEEIKDLVTAHKNLDDIPGVGETIASKLEELFKTGHITAFEKYVAKIPAGMRPLMKLRGVGAKTAYRLASYFDLNDEENAIDQLRQVAQAGKVSTLEGFGEKSENDILTAITDYQKEWARMPLAKAEPIAEALIYTLKQCSAVVEASALGSLRRKASTVGDIDLGITITDIGRVKECVKDMKGVKRVVAVGDQTMRIILDSGQQVDIKVAPLEEWGSFIQHFTGSKSHNIKLRELALKKNLSLSEHGIKDLNTREVLTFADEKKFYQFLGLNWIKPEDRIGADEIEQAKM